MRIIVLLLLLIACNPVKQVLRDREKFDEVAKEVIKAGYCANDTIIVTKSDTLVTTDTVNNIYIDTEYRNDTVYLTKNIRSIATKKIIIKDTIKKVVVDNARINVLEADKAALRMDLESWKDKAQDRLSWLILAAVIIGLWVFFKFKP
jgi:hypothetical protein